MKKKIYYSHRDRGANIYELQTYLRFLATKTAGFPRVVPDGIYGEATKRAVIFFQQRNGLAQTGVVDFETWTRIVEAYDKAGGKGK